MFNGFVDAEFNGVTTVTLLVEDRESFGGGFFKLRFSRFHILQLRPDANAGE